ncbi:MAG: Ig-like domain-containing protein [Armatimonadota bacterium]|nr:Ig-like domain-containing protein [Armatimonadota bacterium]MDR7448348.1 Ig-like domain-containing protein [Armatimonadota bacterium]MDR7479288.1 Ig-like domain-containing protein [Armatimonadota bacterium]MDR7490158.1 Ig-like domain-containing protein [Armatimonadota bacterium]MDR7501041.1 Ig-like domain-containing protein [Armatimonadota bacterium]
MTLPRITLCVLAAAVLTACGSLSGLPPLTPAADATPPTVTATVPQRDGTIPADAQISVTFSKAMNTRSVTVAAEPAVTFAPAEWSADERTVTVRPQNPLNPGTRYTVTVSGRDRAGNTLAPFTWSFTAGPPAARAGTGQARLRDRVEVRADERLFTLFAALNAAGYDEGLRESGAVRQAVRDRLGDLPLRVVEPVRRYREEHPLPLEAYVRSTLTLGAPPGFAEQRALRGLEGWGRVLADFYKAAGVADLWKAQAEAHQQAAAALAGDGLALMGRTLDYLRAGDAPRERLVLVPNLLDAPGRGYLVPLDDVVVFVLGSVGPPDSVTLVTLTARLVLGTLRPEAAAEVQRTSPLFDLVRETAQRHGYQEWAAVIQESLVAAVTARLVLPPDQRAAFLRRHYDRGLILVDHFATELERYERDTAPLAEFLPSLLRTVNLDEQRRLFAERRR